MDASLTDVSERESPLGEVLASLIEAAERGEALDRTGWLARHPEFAAELNEFFDSEGRLWSLAAPLRAVLAADTPRPDAALHEAAASRTRAGQTVGEYEILEEIGRGGMGVVYKARQNGVNRVVALKVLRADPLGGGEHLRRFRNEAEFVARLDHPNIVPLYEVGEHASGVYFSMKLIEGGSLAEQLPWFVSDLRSAAAVVATVAHAVHHAHQRGVLHRDLKPSNILLDEEGRPYVTDFGLARRLEGDSSLTQSGAVVGTPSYMAPEQAIGGRAEVTTATDVHGLGAILFTLLTGRPPFQADAVVDVLMQVREREAERPSRANRRVDRDLETICLKCLAKDPAGRYSTAQGVAEDLERWLRGDAIQARAAGRGQRLWRWCRRNPGPAGQLGTAILLVLALLVGLAVSNRLLARKQAETDAQRKRAEAQRQRAQDNLDKGFTFIHQALGQLAGKDLADVPRIKEIREALIDQAMQVYQRSIQKQSDEPSDRFETARAYLGIGLLFEARGDQAEAIRARETATALFEALVGDFPLEPAYLQQLGHSYHYLGTQLSNIGSEQVAREHLRRAVRAFEQFTERFPNDPGGHNNVAWLLATTKARDVRNPGRAVQFARRAVGLAPDNASIRHTLGCAYFSAGKWEEAINAFERSGTIHPPGDHGTWFFLAMARWQLGQRKQARKWYDKAVEWMEKNSPLTEELRGLRDEARELLGVQDKPAPKNKDGSPIIEE